MNFLILLLLWPLAEIALFFQVASWIGTLDTILLCAASAVVGFLLLQWQGFKTLGAIRAAMLGTNLPQDDIFAGFYIVIAAFLLMLPGFLSDGVALFIVLPPVKKYLRATLSRHFKNRPAPPPDNSIDGEFTRLDDSGKPLLKSAPHTDPFHQ